jgi:2-polyprenyl-3-methyl-5-hydroxy-6-metoxy-1,4-benzoquinol methylase
MLLTPIFLVIVCIGAEAVMYSDQNVAYYNQNVQNYLQRTIDADMDVPRQKFLQYLKPKAKILDAGCGPGRDLSFFHQEGYEVLGFDPAEEMVRYVKQQLHLPALQTSFQDLEYTKGFDGIWAAASLLHVPTEDLPDVFRRLWIALKPQGILFLSFKEGTGSRKEGERTFYDMTAETLLPYLTGFEILDQWIQVPLEKTSIQPCLWLDTVVRKMDSYEKTSAR